MRFSGRPRPRVPQSRAGLILLLGSMTALGAISGDIYLPSLPEVALDLDTSPAGAQATVAATLLGGAIGQLTIGPASDLLGRRRPVLLGLILHVAASLAIIFTPSLTVLLSLRLCQGIGNASAGVVALAVIRDLFSGRKAAALISQLMLVIGVAPLLAPAAGTFIAVHWGWRGCFAVLAVLGSALGIAIWFKLPDTSDPTIRAAASIGSVWRGYGHLLGDRQFMSLALIPGLFNAALMAWVVSSPFLLRQTYDVPAALFPVFFAIGGICLVGGAQLNAALVRRFGTRRLLGLAGPTAFGLALVMFALAHLGFKAMPALLIPLFAILTVAGMGPANASALAMSPHGAIAGTAAALIGGLQVGTSAAVSAIVGHVGQTPADLSTVIILAFVLVMALLLVGGKVYRRQPPPVLP